MKTWLVLLTLLAPPVGGGSNDSSPPAESRQAELKERADQFRAEFLRLSSAGKHDQALKFAEQELKLRRELHAGADHADLAMSLVWTGYLLRMTGQPEKSLGFHEEALTMRRRIYQGQDHANLVNSLDKLAALLESLEQPQKALPLYQEALEIQQRLLKHQDHPDLARRLDELGTLYRGASELDTALQCYQDALAMRQRLYPNQDHADVVVSLNNLGSLYRKLGQNRKALPLYQDALAMSQRVYPNQDQPLVATCLNNLGLLLKELGQPEKTLTYSRQALEMKQRLHRNQDHEDLAVSLNNLGELYGGLGQPEQSLFFTRAALEMRRRLAGNQDDNMVAASLNNLAALQIALGQMEQARLSYEEALAIRQRLYPNQDHSDIALILSNLGTHLQTMGLSEKALPHLQDALAMRRRLYKNQDHADIAISLINLGDLLAQSGQPELALPVYQELLARARRLYKDEDHPNLIASLNNLAHLLKALGEDEKALAYYREALAMSRRLYRDQDHPLLAISLNNLGYVLRGMNQLEEALSFYREALEMKQRMYKDQDHPDLALSLSNVGVVLRSLGQPDLALTYYQKALAMRRRLYQSQEHVLLANSLNQLGSLNLELGKPAEALPLYQEALAMYQRLNARFACTCGLTAALAQLESFPQAHAGVLSASRQLAGSDASAYETLWQSKAAVGQLFRTRRALERQQQSAEMQALLAEYRQVQRRLTGLLAQPVQQSGDQERDKLLKELTEVQQRLELQIGQQLPEQTGLVKLELKQLTGALKPEEVFLDFYQYDDLAAETDQRQERYCVFVVTADRPPVRVELPESVDALDTAIYQWRQKLVEWSPSLPEAAQQELQAQSDRYARQVRELLWKPLETALPSQARWIYISPTGRLAQVPFAAVPGPSDQSILLEQYALATVESGPFLWEHLTRQPAAGSGAETLLVTGGVRYSPAGVPESPWPFLGGSEQEARQVQQFWGKRGELLARTGHEATTDWLLTVLPSVRYAHLATHGEFREEEYAREQARLQQDIQGRIASLDTEESVPSGIGRGAGVRHPLGYVGIVMAHANRPPEGSPDLGIVSGTSLWPLDLSNLKLCVLSACETGLGESSGGAGVQNLQLALHVAGCENVVASLWKVDDAATAALMAKFYYELWERGKPPMEALQEAQLLVRNRPDLIPELSGQRGRIKVAESVQIKPGPTAAETKPQPGEHPRTLPPKYWAAFTLSGAGR